MTKNTFKSPFVKIFNTTNLHYKHMYFKYLIYRLILHFMSIYKRIWLIVKDWKPSTQLLILA